MLLCVRLVTLLRQRGQEGRNLPTERGWRLLATQPRKIYCRLVNVVLGKISIGIR
jgi:hypothetical protein